MLQAVRVRRCFPAWVAALAILLAGCAGKHPPATSGVPTAGAPAPDWGAEVVSIADWGETEVEPMDPLIPPYDPLTAAGSGDQIKARFRGTHRRAAKISITPAAAESEMTIDALAASVEDDDDMLNHSPAITESSSSDRVDEEKRSVRVKAWVYAIKYEKDQDWHLIVGTDPQDGSITYFNCEVSGLPSKTADAYTPLLDVRKSLADLLNNKLPGPGGSYTKYSHPIPVIIEGSLFFDIDHAAGVVGPNGMRPKTAWEIHPITLIEENTD